MPTTMKAVQVPAADGAFQVVDRSVPDPAPGAVRIKVAACGICHSDAFVKAGAWFKIDYPRVPGHEVAGIVDAVGPGVERWRPGDRVGIGWHGHHCGDCDECRSGDFIVCRNLRITGFHFDVVKNSKPKVCSAG